MDRQWPNCDGSGTAGFIGTKGRYTGNEIIGRHPWKFEGQLERSGVYEQRAMTESIRKSKPKAEGQNGAYASLTAIMGRESAYTGKLVTWNEMLNSDLDFVFEEIGIWTGTLESSPCTRASKTIVNCTLQGS
jgi:hypothetical protein